MEPAFHTIAFDGGGGVELVPGFHTLALAHGVGGKLVPGFHTLAIHFLLYYVLLRSIYTLLNTSLRDVGNAPGSGPRPEYITWHRF